MRGRPVDFHFKADPVVLKLVTRNKIVFRVCTGSYLPRLNCKRNARFVAVTDSVCFDERFVNESAMLISPIHGSKQKKVQFMAAIETKTMASLSNYAKWHYMKKVAFYKLFENKNTVLSLYFICLLFNLQMCQIILPHPVLV